jgi:hypothetical protein
MNSFASDVDFVTSAIEQLQLRCKALEESR